MMDAAISHFSVQNCAVEMCPLKFRAETSSESVLDWIGGTTAAHSGISWDERPGAECRSRNCSVFIVILCKENTCSDLTAVSDMLFMKIVFNPECNSTLLELI